ncbi:hypothetical protein FACS1894172_16740 [Spirochaetia bacterium]|nr:hypothetical protein FACS1894172_16740 [Spirochaetia bacterium]
MKIVLDPLIGKAARCIKKGNYDSALKLLEPEVSRYRGFFSYHYVLGIACLYSGDFGGAFTYFKIARDIKMRDPYVLLGIAVLYMRRTESDKALDLYLEVLEVDPKNKIAKNALKIIRKFAGTDNFLVFAESGKIKRLYPPIPPAPITPAQIIIGAAGILVIGILVTGYLFKTRRISLPFFNEREGLELSALSWEEKNHNAVSEGDFAYTLSQQHIVDYYEKARSLFNDYHDEQAKVALNRILESNATESVKNKARILISYMNVPGFDTLKDRFSYADVLSEPLLYRNCYVLWRGRAANLDMQQESTTFSFLIGYDSRNIVEGIVPVSFDFAVPVNTEQPLEILGKVIPVESEQGTSIRLQGTALHQARILLTGE